MKSIELPEGYEHSHPWHTAGGHVVSVYDIVCTCKNNDMADYIAALHNQNLEVRAKVQANE